MTEYAAAIAAVVVQFVGNVDRLKMMLQLVLARLQNPKTERNLRLLMTAHHDDNIE